MLKKRDISKKQRVREDILRLYSCSLSELLNILKEIESREISGELKDVQLENDHEEGMVVTGLRLETDLEFNRRMKAINLKKKLERENKLSKEQRDIEEYKRLKRKFEKR